MRHRGFQHDVTHWPVTGSDGFGGFLFGPPVLLKGRWEDKQILFIDVNGEEMLSSAIVYLGSDIDTGDYLGLGDYTDPVVVNPTTLTTTFRIRQRDRTTDLRNVRALRKAYL